MEARDPGQAVHNFSYTNYVATDPLPRDQTQSLRLHEPSWMVSTIDPITGNDIDMLAKHPHIIDGNVTMFFESEETKQAYLDMPIDHPFHLVDNPTDEGYDEG
jgi:YHS domain-containing protein